MLAMNVLKEEVYLLETITLLEAINSNEFDLSDPDSIESFVGNNSSLIKNVLKAFSIGLFSKLSHFAAKDFYRGLFGKDKIFFNMGARIRQKVLSLYAKTIGKGAEKFGRIINKTIKVSSRYFKKPTGIAGSVLVVSGLVFLTIGKAKIETPDVKNITNTEYIKSLSQKLLKQFDKLMKSNKYTKIGLGLIVVGLMLLTYTFVKY